jgi:predicted TIM-barrel fold metal-dependent hydrolase
VLKIHPPTQGVDVADPNYARFFRRCADRKVLVMIHTGHEHACPVIDIRLADPRKLALALGEGCTVVACHCGTGWNGDQPDMVPAFLEMLRKHKNLWGDTSILGAPQHVADCLRVLADPAVEDRLLHGSDFPFESAPVAFAKKIGWGRAAQVQAISNVLARDLALKEALGAGRPSAERAWRLVCGTA